MLTSLADSRFFAPGEIERLRELGLWRDSDTTPAKLAFAGLLMAPIMQIIVRDDVTSPAEFQIMQDYIHVMTRQFGLATEADIESIGTDMGLLPMLRGSWDAEKFQGARALLTVVVGRLTEPEADMVRNAVSKAALDAVRAGSTHMISLHLIDEEERQMVQDLIRDLNLDRSTEGMHLLSKARG